MNNLAFNYQQAVKIKVERMKCPEHGEHPKVIFTEQGVRISCCCDKFLRQVENECDKAITQAIDDEITNMFK